jgi:hypothetical protein
LEVFASGSGDSPAKAVVSHRVILERKPGKELTKEQESLLAKIVHEDQTWAEIGQHFPGHTLPSLKENFTKQGGLESGAENLVRGLVVHKWGGNKLCII